LGFLIDFVDNEVEENILAAGCKLKAVITIGGQNGL